MKAKTFSSCYEIGNQIGTGAFAEVRECTDILSGNWVAVKIVQKSTISFTEAERIKREARILESICHRNIEGFIDFFDEPEAFYLVLERCHGISLYSFISSRGDLPERVTITIMRQILHAIVYLHSKGIAHCDIKPENIIIEPKSLRLKLVDFGFATDLEIVSSDFVGSISYAAPELFLGEAYDPLAADIWAIGVVHYILCTGQFPWRYESDQIKPKPKIRFTPKRRSSTDMARTNSPLVHHAQRLIVQPRNCYTLPSSLFPENVDPEVSLKSEISEGYGDDEFQHALGADYDPVQTAQIIAHIMKADYKPLPDSISPKLVGIINMTLKLNPGERSVANAISDILDAEKPLKCIVSSCAHYSLPDISSRLPRLHTRKIYRASL